LARHDSEHGGDTFEFSTRLAHVPRRTKGVDRNVTDVHPLAADAADEPVILNVKPK
jgi:hypothetical protein